LKTDTSAQPVGFPILEREAFDEEPTMSHPFHLPRTRSQSNHNILAWLQGVLWFGWGVLALNAWLISRMS